MLGDKWARKARMIFDLWMLCCERVTTWLGGEREGGWDFVIGTGSSEGYGGSVIESEGWTMKFWFADDFLGVSTIVDNWKIWDWDNGE